MQAAPEVVDEQLAHSNNHSQVYADEQCAFVVKRYLSGFTREVYNWRRLSLLLRSEHLLPLDACFSACDDKERGEYVVMPRLYPLPHRVDPRRMYSLCLCVRDMCRRGAFHLDIKPHNIMQNAKGDYVLIDYGLMSFERSVHDFPGTRGYIDMSTADCESRVVYALGRTLAKLGARADTRLLEYCSRRGKRSMEHVCRIYSSLL